MPLSFGPRLKAFLAEPLPITVGTTRRDGSVQMNPVWYEYRDGLVWLNGGPKRGWVRHMRRDPRVSLCIDDDTPPYAFVIFEGIATLSEDPAELLRWATSIAGRYMGSDQAEAFGRRNGVPGELLVRVTPTRVVAQTKISD